MCIQQEMHATSKIENIPLDSNKYLFYIPFLPFIQMEVKCQEHWISFNSLRLKQKEFQNLF